MICIISLYGFLSSIKLSRRDKPSSNPDTELDLISAVRKDLVVLGSSRGFKSSLNNSNALIASPCAF